MPSADTRARSFMVSATLALLLAAYVVAFAQRQLPATLAPQIVDQFGISDAALGALHRSGFALAYGLLAVFGGWLVDRGARVRILAAGLGVASLATAASAWATGVEDPRGGPTGGRPRPGGARSDRLFADRRPCADAAKRARNRDLRLRPADRRGADATRRGRCRHRDRLGRHLLSGGRGRLFVAVLLGSLPDPPRRAHSPRATPEVIDHLRSHWPAVLAVLATMLCNASAGQILLGWTTSWLMRDHGLGSAAAGSLFGLAVLVGGTSGTLVAGAAGDLLRKRFCVSRLVVLAGAALLGACAASLAFTSPDGMRAAALLFPTLFLLAAAHATGPAALQDITPAALRGRQHGAAVLLINLFGFALGPWLVGLASDLDGRSQALGDILAIAVPAILAASGTAALLGARTQARSAAAVAQATAPGRLSSAA